MPPLTRRVLRGVDVDVVLPGRAENGLSESGGGVDGPWRIAELEIGEVDGWGEVDHDWSDCARVPLVDVGSENAHKAGLWKGIGKKGCRCDLEVDVTFEIRVFSTGDRKSSPLKIKK